MVKLGFWQLDRANRKSCPVQRLSSACRAQQARPADRQTIGANSLNRFELITLQAKFDTKRYFLLDNQMVEGQPGYHVIALLKALN